MAAGSPKSAGNHPLTIIAKGVDQLLAGKNTPLHKSSSAHFDFNAKFPVVKNTNHTFATTRIGSLAASDSLPNLPTHEKHKAIPMRQLRPSTSQSICPIHGSKGHRSKRNTDRQKFMKTRNLQIKIEGHQGRKEVLRTQLEQMERERTAKETSTAERERLKTRDQADAHRRHALHLDMLQAKHSEEQKQMAELEGDYDTIEEYWSKRGDQSLHRFHKLRNKQPGKTMSEVILSTPIAIIECDKSMINNPEEWRAKQRAKKMASMKLRHDELQRMEDMMAYYEEQEKKHILEEKQKQMQLKVINNMKSGVQEKKYQRELEEKMSIAQQREAKREGELKVLAEIRSRVRFGSLGDVPREVQVENFKKLDQFGNFLLDSHALSPLVKTIVDYYWMETTKSGMEAIKELRSDYDEKKQKQLFGRLFKLPAIEGGAAAHVYKEVEFGLRATMQLTPSQVFTLDHFLDGFKAYCKQMEDNAAKPKQRGAKGKNGTAAFSLAWGHTSNLAKSAVKTFVDKTRDQASETRRIRNDASSLLHKRHNVRHNSYVYLRKSGYIDATKDKDNFNSLAVRIAKGDVIVMGDRGQRNPWGLHSRPQQRPSTTILSSRRQVMGGRPILTI